MNIFANLFDVVVNGNGMAIITFKFQATDETPEVLETVVMSAQDLAALSNACADVLEKVAATKRKGN